MAVLADATALFSFDQKTSLKGGFGGRLSGEDKRVRDRALFDLTIDSKLRGCDLLEITIGYLVAGSRVRTRAMVSHQKTKWPVEFKYWSQRYPASLLG